MRSTRRRATWILLFSRRRTAAIFSRRVHIAYLAAAEGYETAEGSFTVEETAEEPSIEIVLTAVAEEPAAEDEPVLLAEDYIASGTCGDNLTWTIDHTQGTLTISGTGDMADEPDFGEYKMAVHFIAIQSGVTSIGKRAFRYCDPISVTITDTVTSIADEAFYGCRFSSILIPASVTSIGEAAFQDCSGTNVYYTGSEEDWKRSLSETITLLC